MPGAGIEQLREDFAAQESRLADRPSFARLFELIFPLLGGWLGEELDAAWSARTFSADYERPLLFLAALRYAALRGGPSHPLHGALVASPAVLDGVTEATLRAALREPTVARALRERTVQTNETTRAVAWLWPAHLLWQAQAREPLALVDLGTSAGLNLVADSLPTPWVDEHGAQLNVAPRPQVALRLGLDRAPLDVRDEDDADWLRACVWQDDAARLERLEQGLSAFRAATASGAPDAPRLERRPLGEVGATLATLPAKHRALLLQTVVRDYVPPDEWQRQKQAILTSLAERPVLSALWVQLELSGSTPTLERAMALSATFRGRDGVREIVLARSHPHPRVLYVDGDAVAELGASARASAPLG